MSISDLKLVSEYKFTVGQRVHVPDDPQAAEVFCLGQPSWDDEPDDGYCGTCVCDDRDCPGPWYMLVFETGPRSTELQPYAEHELTPLEGPLRAEPGTHACGIAFPCTCAPASDPRVG